MDKFFQILYVPFGFLFRILFDFVGNYGLALIIFTLFFRLILLPSAIKQQKGMAKQYRLQPKLKRIREKYQDYAPNERNQKIQMETNELYQQEGYSAMTGGCAPLLLQLPILWGLYGIIRHPMYAVTIWLFLSIPVVLGSLWSILCFLPYIAVSAETFTTAAKSYLFIAKAE